MADEEDDASGQAPGSRSLQAEQLLIEGYLSGGEKEFREVEGWLRREIDLRYPALRDERDDLSQKVHEKLLVSLRAGRFRHDAALRTFVTSVVHHTCIDALRRRYLARLAEGAGETGPDNRAADWGNPYLDYEKHETAQILHRVLHLSPEICRRLWRMIFIDRFHYDEIASRLSIPAGTVKSRVFTCRQRALAIFRKLTLGGRRR